MFFLPLPIIYAIFTLIGFLLGWSTVKLIKAIAKTPRYVDKEYKDRLVISLYGAASSGKSSGGKALFGIDNGTIHPIPGTTKKVSVCTLPQGMSVADTPGLQDTNEELVKRAKNFIDNVDIFIYVINLNGGVTKKVKADLLLLKEVKRPLAVVLNKIDTIDSKKRDEFIGHQKSVVESIHPWKFFTVAFDPLPQISKKPINVVQVLDWVTSTVKEKGNELLKEKQNAEVI
ncbi:MAG: putative GTPase protein [Candidatus Scalindua rubra]|uniref:Putative GTPase protein n=1 Tax=Candidatus Scalindua rubra TaxID=1872076 RepID=A0A1E3X8E8_9BACT|nr:MAG: putative GTPase protein [Candidatus Scalindua rubra]